MPPFWLAVEPFRECERLLFEPPIDLPLVSFTLWEDESFP